MLSNQIPLRLLKCFQKAEVLIRRLWLVVSPTMQLIRTYLCYLSINAHLYLHSNRNKQTTDLKLPLRLLKSHLCNHTWLYVVWLQTLLSVRNDFQGEITALLSGFHSESEQTAEACLTFSVARKVLHQANIWLVIKGEYIYHAGKIQRLVFK